MKLHQDAIRASIRRSASYLDRGIVDEIIAGLVADGLVDDGDGAIRAVATPVTTEPPASVPYGHERGRLTFLQAAEANPMNLSLLKNLRARAERFGIDVKLDVPIDLRQLNTALESCDIDERFSFKTDLAKLGLIP